MRNLASTKKRHPVGGLKYCLMALCALLLASALISNSTANAGTCPEATVAIKAGNAFLKAAKTGNTSDFASALATYSDMTHISMFGLGKYRSSLPRRLAAEYVSLSSRYVASTLSGFARKFRANSIEFIDCQGDQVITRLNFGGGRRPQRVIWRFAHGKVIDINVQNAWLVQLLRSNFVGILNDADGNIGTLLSTIKVASDS